MDEIDQQIIALLSLDARMSLTEIGKKVHRSRVAVLNRIKALVADGEIISFGITLKPKQLSVLFEITFNPDGKCDIIVPRFRSQYQFIKVWSVTGSTDLFMLAQANEADEIHAMRNFLLQQPEIATVSTHTITKTYS